jgi:hypothetical protein
MKNKDFPINVLVICPRSLDFINFDSTRYSNQYKFSFLEASIELSGFSKSFDILAYLEKCRSFIHKNNIDIIVSTQDIPALIQAKLYDEFENLSSYRKSASLESSLLCLHKYYTRKYIDPSPIPFYALDLNNEEKIDTIDIPFPWILKPCTTACSSEIHKVFNLDEAISLLPNLKEKIIDGNQYLMPFFKKYFDKYQYPLLDKNIILIEQFIPSLTRCCVDGCVYDGEILIWGISEVNSYTDFPESMSDFLFPSLLSQETQLKLKEQYINIVNKLIDYGFNRQFVNVEFFVRKDGSLKLIEINGRLSPASTTLYRQCLINGDPYEALLQMSQSDCPAPPKWNNLYGGLFYVTVFSEGLAEELIDFKAIETFPEIEMRVKPNQYIDCNKDMGTNVASFSLIGECYEDMCSQADIIRNTLLLSS